ncbi:DUF2778 domain-containing protein [Ochrobactrum sp. EDr1-4]|uniref:DUF2778 domain-containing protein n=1 Tax=Ochrobactrum sp. EDr1-4 TaxID=3368622 RepID=UPI003BA3BD29
MALVTDTFDFSFDTAFSFRYKFSNKKNYRFPQIATILAVGLFAFSGVLSAIGVAETVLPIFASVAPVMRRLPGDFPQKFATVNHSLGIDNVIRQRFIAAYTADTRYSNVDWHRNKVDGDRDIISDIGPDSVIEEKVAISEKIVEPRAERVPYTPIKAERVAEIDASHLGPDVAPQIPIIKNAPEKLMPDEVPLPSRKPVISRLPAQTTRYATEATRDDEPKHDGLLKRLFRSPINSRTAIYDISAATVYLPNGERLEAHSGIGPMRDNPNSVTQKNRGATPPHTYNLRMRESLFHGVAAIRLTPVDGRNPHNRDGLLAHTYMLGKSGNSNGCVVFKDYPRFLNAFKRGEFNQLVVVSSMTSKTPRVASIF